MLFAENNTLDGTIPASIGIMKNLKTFDVGEINLII